MSFLAPIPARAIGRRARQGVLTWLVTAMLAVAGLPATAQTPQGTAADPNLEFPTRLHQVQREGYSISALVTHHAAPQAFRHGIALFPGHPGILKLREEAGQLQLDLRGNFLVRSRRQWLDDDILVAVLDAPSDQWATFSQHWRETPRYGADIATLLGDVSARHRVASNENARPASLRSRERWRCHWSGS